MKFFSLTLLIQLTLQSNYSQTCLPTKSFKLKDAKCIVEKQQVFFPFNVDVKTFQDSISIIIYEPDNKIELIVKIKEIVSCKFDATNDDFKGVFNGDVYDYDDENEVNTTKESKIEFSKNNSIYTLKLVVPNLNSSTLIMNLIEKKKKKSK